MVYGIIFDQLFSDRVHALGNVEIPDGGVGITGCQPKDQGNDHQADGQEYEHEFCRDGAHHLTVPLKAITGTINGLNVDRVMRVILDLGTQVLDVQVDGTLIADVTHTLHDIQKFQA